MNEKGMNSNPTSKVPYLDTTHCMTLLIDDDKHMSVVLTKIKYLMTFREKV